MTTQGDTQQTPETTQPRPQQLRLDGKTPLNRVLVIRGSSTSLFAALYRTLDFNEPALAYVVAELSICCVRGRILWIGTTAFEVSAEEAQIIRDTFGLRGLDVVADKASAAGASA